MTSTEPAVLEQAGEQFDGPEPPLPAHYCGRCMSVVYRADRRCVDCGRTRPRQGWDKLVDSGDPWLGRIMDGRYLITRRLGKGASAIVYEAESLNISRQFAVKVVDLNACSSDKDPALVRARLDREVEAIGRLRNPHTVPFYEVLELSESCMGVVMKFVQGETLDRVLASEGAMDWRRACKLLRQIANGVHEAHSAGLIHRDLKPANIMVEPLTSGDEFAHVLDFGIVWMDDGVEVTQGFVGTPLYASPEQALGKPVDQRSDIYSLGAMFFQMLTGRPPFDSKNVIEVLRMHVRRTPPTLEEATDGLSIPFQVQNLVEKMLSKSRHARPDNLTEVIASVDTILRTNIDLPSEPACSASGRARQLDSREIVMQTAHGLGVIENGADNRTNAQTIEAADADEVLGEITSDAFLQESLAAVDSLGDPPSFFESEERDQTGPKAAIFHQRTTDRHEIVPRRPS